MKNNIYLTPTHASSVQGNLQRLTVILCSQLQERGSPSCHIDDDAAVCAHPIHDTWAGSPTENAQQREGKRQKRSRRWEKARKGTQELWWDQLNWWSSTQCLPSTPFPKLPSSRRALDTAIGFLGMNRKLPPLALLLNTHPECCRPPARNRATLTPSIFTFLELSLAQKVSA